MSEAVNKQKILQEILDQEDELWIIIKPSRLEPSDPDSLCIFQNPAKYKEARADIPTAWFRDGGEFNKIEEAVWTALSHAEERYPSA